MSNKYLFKITLTLFFILLAFGEVVDFTYSQYKIDDIKQFDIEESCNTLSDCPKYAIDCAKDSQNSSLHCIYPDFVCSGNQNCYALNNSTNYNMFMNDDEKTYYTALDKNMEKKKIIAKSCNVSKDFDRDYNGKPDTCNTAKCNSNDECLSNKCVSGMCQINESSPTYYCKVSAMYYLCYQLLDEHCTSDNNCASFKCHESDYICVKEASPIVGGQNDDDQKKSNNGLIIGSIIALVAIIILVLICCLCMKRSEKNKSKK